MAEEPLPDRLRRALTAAMKARDRAAVSALRSALGAIENAEAVDAVPLAALTDGPIAGAVSGLGRAEAARRELSAAEVRAVVVAQIDEREHAADEYEQLGRPDRASALRDEVAVLRVHLGS